LTEAEAGYHGPREIMMRTRSTLWLAWAYGFFTVAGLAGNRAFLLGAAAVAALGVMRSRRTAPAQT
jgi:hypothetical protein